MEDDHFATLVDPVGIETVDVKPTGDRGTGLVREIPKNVVVSRLALGRNLVNLFPQDREEGQLQVGWASQGDLEHHRLPVAGDVRQCRHLQSTRPKCWSKGGG